MKTNKIMAAGFLLMPFFPAAQQLPRKAGLGVAYYALTPDSLKTKLGYTTGAIVQYAVAGGTASQMGVETNDIILAVNEKPVVSPPELAAAAKNLRQDETVTLRIIRNNQTITLTGKALARPKETSATADVLYGEFAYKQGYVRTIYKSPRNKKPVGTVYFLQGLPCYSMDNFKATDKTKQAIDAMVDRGFAVYRMEKADMGDNSNQAPCITMGFDEELAMYRAGYQHLLTLPYVDTGKIFLFGHSMGGVTAPLLAQEFQPLGVTVYGTVFKPWMEYMLEAFRIQSGYYGAGKAQLDNALRNHRPHIEAYFSGKKTLQEIAKDPGGSQALEQILSYDPATGLGASGRSPLVFKEINQHNLSKAWQQTKSHLLAVYGECDIAANNADDHKALVAFHQLHHPGKARFWQAPGATHTFEDIGTMEQFIRWQNTPAEYYKYAEEHFSAGIFDYVCGWMKEVAAARK